MLFGGAFKANVPVPAAVTTRASLGAVPHATNGGGGGVIIIFAGIFARRWSARAPAAFVFAPLLDGLCERGDMLAQVVVVWGISGCVIERVTALPVAVVDEVDACHMLRFGHGAVRVA